MHEEANAEEELIRCKALEEAAAELAQKQKEAKQNALLTRDDYAAFYTNPSLEEEENRIFVPCSIAFPLSETLTSGRRATRH